MTSRALLSDGVRLAGAGIYEATEHAWHQSWLFIPALCVLYPAAGLVLTAELEIFYRIFEFAAGDGGYWSPAIMALTGVIMLVLFHLTALRHGDHPVVRVMTRIAPWVVVVYAVGAGTFVAALLYRDGLSAPPVMSFDDFAAVPASSWLDQIFAEIADPASTILFCLGVGGLSIVCLCAGHLLVTQITWLHRERRARRDAWQQAKEAQSVIDAEEQRYAEIEDERERLQGQDRSHWRGVIAQCVMTLIVERLVPHETALQEIALGQGAEDWSPDRLEQAERAAVAVERIRSISHNDILKALNPTQRRKTS